MKACRNLCLGACLFALGASIVACSGVGQQSALAQQPTEGQARLTPPPPPPPPPPAHPSTQSPEHKVTPDQMKKWEKELSNWGRWGKDDQLGAINLITTAKRKQAAALVKIPIPIHWPSVKPNGIRGMSFLKNSMTNRPTG